MALQPRYGFHQRQPQLCRRESVQWQRGDQEKDSPPNPEMRTPALVVPPRRPAEYENLHALAVAQPAFEDEQLAHLLSDALSSRLRSTPSMWRNAIALYLRVAGVPLPEIARFLGISASRVNGIVAKTRKLISGAMSSSMRDKPRVIWVQGAKYGFSMQELTAHRLRADAMAMREAEAALSHCLHGQPDVISAALKWGRGAFQSRQDTHGAWLCSCCLCATRPMLAKTPSACNLGGVHTRANHRFHPAGGGRLPSGAGRQPVDD